MNKASRVFISLGLVIVIGLPETLLAGLPGISIRSLQVDPDVPSTLYAGFTNGSVAKSVDGGANWTIVPTIVGSSTNPVTEIEIDPSANNIIYASGSSRGSVIAKSVDSGATWLNSRDPGDGSPFGTGFPAPGVVELEVDPNNSNIVYAGTRATSTTGEVYRSTDGGMNWSTALLNTFLIRDLLIDPVTPTTLYVAARTAGVYKSIDSGTNWVQTNIGIAGQGAEELAIDPTTPTTLYLGTASGGLFKTIDGGANWTQMNSGLTTGRINELVIDPNNTSIVYAANDVLAGGIFKSINAGASWTQINTGLTSGMPAMLRKPQELAIDPVTSSSVYAGTEDGVFKSSDSGANWTTPPPVIMPPSASDDGSAGTLYAVEAGDPINTFNGELFNPYFTDINLGGPMALAFQRYYGAFTRRNLIVGDLGSNWRHNFDARLNISGNTGKYISSKGRVTNFLNNLGVWQQQDNLDTPYQLSKPAAQDAILYDPLDDRIYTFDFTTSSVIIGKLVKVEDGKGNVHTITYELVEGQILTVSDGIGRTLSFTYNADAIPKISIVSDGARAVNFAYTDANDSEYLTQVTDVRAGMTTYLYKNTSANADHALILQTTLPRTNIPFKQTFDSLGRVDSQDDSNSHTTLLSYAGSETTVEDPLGNTKVHSYTASGELIGSEDADNLDVSLGSDATGRRNMIADRLAGITSFDFHAASGLLSTLNNADGSSSSFSYSARSLGALTLNDLTGITHADATTETLAYDPKGNLLSHTDQNGNARTFTYNGFGQVLSITNKLGGDETNTYNGDGTLDVNTDPSNNMTSFSYDLRLRPILVSLADGNTIDLTYDNANNLLTRTNEDGNTTTMVYDANGNLSSVTEPLLNTTGFDYDGNDRLLTLTAPLTGETSLTYDELGRVSTSTDANGNEATAGYDSRGRLTSWTDPLDNIWQSSFNAESVLASITDPLANTTSFTSDSLGRVTQITSPLNNVHQFGYDSMGRITSTTDALNQTTTISRDLRGRVSVISLPGGTVTAGFTRNALGQITTLTDANNNNWLREYDVAGRLISVTDPLLQSRTTTYDFRNRPLVTTFAGALGTRTNSYNGAGHLTDIAFFDGTTLTLGFTRDDNDRLTGADSGAADNVTRGYDANNNIVDSNGILITRDAGGRIETMALAAGKTVTYAYDDNSRLISVTDWDAGVTTFDYDTAGKLTGINRPNGIHAIKTYDDDSRLSGISEGIVSSIDLTRDANGQIVTANRNVPTAGSSLALTSDNASFDAASQIDGATYDAEGRLTAAGADSYTWNLASQLQSYTVGGNTVTQAYDALGRRISRTANAVTRDYVWNDALGLPSISVEVQASVDQRYYIHTPSGALLYSMDAATDARRFYHFDEMGNAVFISDDLGTVIGSYAYTPFGELIASAGGLDNPFTWQGQFGLMDEGNGLYYDRARFYDSNTRRFLSRDPIVSTTPHEINPYQYALNNPLRYVDINGLDPELPRDENRSSHNGYGYRSDFQFLAEILLQSVFQFFDALANAFVYGNDIPAYLNATGSPLSYHQPRYAYRVGFTGDVVLLPPEELFEGVPVEYVGGIEPIVIELSDLEAIEKLAPTLPSLVLSTPRPRPKPADTCEPKKTSKSGESKKGGSEPVELGGLGGFLYFMGVPPEVILSETGEGSGMQQIDPPALQLDAGPVEEQIKSVVPDLAPIVPLC